jgi:glycosyltransferase involved in cell wall biosynthesis
MISVITPVFNGESSIRQTLDSLAAQRTDLEHVIMDAGSKDNTLSIIRGNQSRYKTRLVSEPDEGLYDAVQRGFQIATGDVLGWINAGDIYFEWTLQVVQTVFNLNPGVEWITGVPFTCYKTKGLSTLDPFCPVYSKRIIARGLHNGAHLPCLQQESMFWRRSLWERSNGAQVLKGQGRGKGYASDYKLWRRFAEFAELKTVCTVLAAFEVAPGQITDRHLAAYRRECGVDPSTIRPNRLCHRLWRLYSFLNLRRVIKLDSL